MRENDREPSDPAVLCLDTCSILDTLRDPVRRRDIKVEEHEACLRLLQIAERGIDLEVRIAAQVRDEYAGLVDQIQTQADESLARFLDEIYKIDRLVDVHGGIGSIDSSHWEGHVQRCRQVADRWLRVAKIPPTPSDIAHRAFTRVMKPLRPARTGKESMKDCVILETYLDYVTSIRSKSSRKVVFVSSNKNDYANDRGISIADELREEFNNLALEYAPNMRSAGGLLGL